MNQALPARLATTAENVGKCYHIYDRPIDRLRQSFSLGHKRRYREFWALRDVSFEIERGETLGIVGVNGSGKSTLLQLLFGVLQPTEGRIRVNGKVGGLLELGAGFNPEETGRENVMVNAAILGVEPDHIPALCDEVAAFADIGDFLDQPIKVYSSGMVVRLGFALQISVPYDVLIIDEALAVGDELFQRKCFAAMEKFKDKGGTIVFVSHAAAAIKQFCRKAIFLNRGQLVQQGACKVVVENYQKFLYMAEPARTQFREELSRGVPVPAAENGPTEMQVPMAENQEGLASQATMQYQPMGATITNPRIETLEGQKVNLLNPHQRYRYSYRVDFQEDAKDVSFGWLVKSTSGVELGGGTHNADSPTEAFAGSTYEICFEFTASLYPGIYYLNCGVSGTTARHQGFLHRVIDAVAFRMRSVYSKVHPGFVDLNYQSTCRLIK